MCKDHAGGAVPEGMFRVPVEWAEEIAHAVSVDQFNFEGLDRIEDQILEEIQQGRSVAGFIKGLAEQFMIRERLEVCSKLLALITTHRKPGLAADQLACAAGLYLTADIPWPALAKKHGVSKQAFEQGVERYRETLGLRKTRTMRDDQARHTMRQSNYRSRRIS